MAFLVTETHAATILP